jgi:Cyclic nucleotide-binding domain
MFWLRAVAVIGLSLEILYFWLSGGDLRAGIGWDLIFIAINLYQIYRLMKDRLSLRLPEPDRELLRGVLSGLDDSQIARLLVAGEFCDIANGATLAEENKPLARMFFICSGRVRGTIAGREVSYLERGNFVGEVAFLTERPATARVIAEGDVRALGSRIQIRSSCGRVFGVITSGRASFALNRCADPAKRVASSNRPNRLTTSHRRKVT